MPDSVSLHHEQCWVTLLLKVTYYITRLLPLKTCYINALFAEKKVKHSSTLEFPDITLKHACDVLHMSVTQYCPDSV